MVVSCCVWHQLRRGSLGREVAVFSVASFWIILGHSLQRVDVALTHIGHYRAHGSPVNVRAGELVRGDCGHQGLAWAQKASREIHSKDMHGGLTAMIVSILGQAVPESQIAGDQTNTVHK